MCLIGFALAFTMAAPAGAAVTPDAAKEAALAAIKPQRLSGPTIIFRLRAPLPAGTVIREAGSKRPTGSEPRSLPVVLRVAQEPAYFFYADRGPYMAYGHEGRVVLVGRRTGDVRTSRTLAWQPVIDGKLPDFLRSSSAYDAASNRVFASDYTVSSAPRAAGGDRVAGVFGSRLPSAFSSAVSESRAAALLAAERSCGVGVASRLSSVRGALPSGGALLPLLRFPVRGRRSLASFVAGEAVDERGCRDILISIAGDGYPSASEPTVRVGVSLARKRMRAFDVGASTLRAIIAAHPQVTFKLMLDAPRSGAFIDALKSLPNLVVIATSSGADQQAFRYLPRKRDGARRVSNPTTPVDDSSFISTQLLGALRFVGSDAEVGNAADQIAGGRAPSFLALMIARAFALGEPDDFTANLGVNAQLFTQVAASAPGAGTPPGGTAPSGGTPPIPNRPPTATAQSVAAIEDTAKSITLSGTDPDGNALSFAVAGTPAHGTLTGVAPDLTYTPAANYGGPDSFTFTASDGALTSDPATVSISVAAVEDPPVTTSGGGALAYTENDAPTAIDTTITITDLDSANLTGATVQVTGGYQNGEDLLALPAQPAITGSFDAATGTLTLTGTASVAAYETALEAVTYANTSDDPDTSPRTVTYAARDAGGFGPSDTHDITITAQDDDPVAVDDSATVDEDSGANAVGVLTNDTDVDGGPKSIASASDPANGTVVITGGGTGLTYQPDPNYCNDPGAAPDDTFTYTLNGGSTATVSMTVTCVDDAPTAVNDSATVAEDSGATTVAVLANDTDIDGGPMSIGSVTQPADGTVAITGGGTGLTYAPDLNYCNDPPGTTPDTFTYTLDGGSTATVSMTVTCVDDAPTAVNDTATVLEDSGATAVTVLVNDTDVDGGPKSIASAGDPANGTVVITGGGTGLTYAPDANYCNDPDPAPVDTFTYTLNGGSTATVSMTVTCIGDPPVAVDDAATVDEDSGANTVAVLTNDTDVDGGPKSIGSAGDPANGTVVITGGGTELTYAPDANYCNDPPGTTPDTFTYTLNGGSTATVSMTVTCVDDAPTAVNDTATVLEDSGATAVTVLVNDTDIDGGPKTIASASDPANGTVVITGGGTGLTYAPDANYCNDPPGTTPDTFTYTLDGGSTATVSMTVTCVDDAPTAVNDTATVLEDSGATAVTVLVNDTDIDGGTKTIASASDPANGTVVITGVGTGLTYQPDANYCNDPPGTTPDTFTYTLNGGSQATVSMTVTCVNDAPVADDETFDGANAAIGNTAFIGDDPSDGPPALGALEKTITADILAGDTDVDGPGPLTVQSGTFASNDGGSVTIESDGDFTYTPAAATSCTDTSDFFDYTVTDNNPGTPGTDTGRVTITLAGCVWYVHNNAAGNAGTSTAPFDTLAQAETESDSGHTVFVFDGDDTPTGYGAGIDLKTDQRLLGEAATLAVGGHTLHTADALKRPTITDNNADVVVLASGNTVRGIGIDPQGTGGGIAGGAGDAGGTIGDVRIIDTGAAGTQPGLELSGTTAAFNVSDLTVDNSAATGTASGSAGVLLLNAGTVGFQPAGTVSITTKGAKGLDATGTNMGAGSEFDAITVTGSGTGAVSMTGTTGTTSLGDGSGTDLDLTTTSGAPAAFRLDNAGSVTVPAGGTADVSATGGPAVDVTGTSGASLSFDSVSSTSSANDGVNLDGLGAGTFSAASGAIGGAAGISFDLAGGSGNVTYPGALNDGAGQAAELTGRSGGSVSLSGPVDDDNDAGGGISLSGNTGGSTTFSNGSKRIDSGAGSAIVMSASDGHTLRLSGGGLDLDATSGRGLDADASGTIAVTGSGNTIATTTGRALSIVNTDIHADDVTLQSISSNGASNGIVLNTTGPSGNLAVTGSGGTCTPADTGGCTGGTIASSTGGDDSSATPGGTGIVLRNTTAPSLTRMWLHDHSNYAIRGTAVAGFTLADSVVNGTNGNNATTPFDDSSVWFDNLTGSASVTGTAISGGFEDNFRVLNTAGSLDRIAFSSSMIGLNSTAQGNDGIGLRSTATAGALKATVQNSTLTGARGDVVDYDHNGSGAGDLVLTSNGFSNNHPAIATGGGGLTLSNNGASGNTTMSITGNSFRDAVGPGVLAVRTIGPSSQTGTFSNNTIGVPVTANSGSREGSAVKLQTVDQGALNWTVTNNQIHGYNNNAIELLAGGGATPQSGTINATITGNTITQPGNTPGTITIPKQGVHLNIGTVPGDSFQACAVISGNNLAASGADGVPATGVNVDVRLRQRQNTTLRLPGYAGAPTDTAAVQAFVAANNPGGTAVLAQASGTGGGFTGTGTTCP